MMQIDIKFTLIFLLFLSFYTHPQNIDTLQENNFQLNRDKKDEISIEISANEILQDEYCSKNINNELCADISLKIAQLYYSRGKRDKNRVDFQKAANICCILIQGNIDIETEVKVYKILESLRKSIDKLDYLKNADINTSCKKQPVLVQNKVYDQYQAIKPKTTVQKEKREKTHFMWGGAFIMYGIAGSLNHKPDTIIYNNNDQADTVVPDYSHLQMISNLKGFSVVLEICNIANTPMGIRFSFLDFLFSESLKMYQCHLDVIMKLPLVKKTLWIPIGAGVKGACLWFDWEYSKKFESMYRNIPIDKIGDSGNLKRFEFGFHGFGGIRLKLGKSPFQIFAEAGYSYHPSLGTWRYYCKTGKKDENGNDEWETIKIHERYLPYNDVQIKGLYLKAGILGQG